MLVRCVYLILVFWLLSPRTFGVAGKHHIDGKSIFLALSIYLDLSVVAGVAREFDIRKIPDDPFTVANVIGVDFVIPAIYMIREAIKSFA